MSTLYAGGGDDILIAGSTIYDNRLAYNAYLQAFGAIMAEWDRPHTDYATRLAHLRGGLPGGLNGSDLLWAGDVIKGAGVDTIFGDAANDFFFARLMGTNADTVNGRRNGEVVVGV